jgi:hypothetical protein
MAVADDIDSVLKKLSAFTAALSALSVTTYAEGVLINDAIANATQLSRDLLHLKLVATLNALHAAQASLSAQTARLKAQADSISHVLGAAADALNAVAIATEIAVAVASF